MKPDQAKNVQIGVDEAGRGPLAGAVVCAAVLLDPQQPILGLADSKQLSESQRDALAALIKLRARAFEIVEVSAERIDQINIFQATMEGMHLCISRLWQRIQPKVEQTADFSEGIALIDGNKVPKNLPIAALAIVKGDQTEPCISAASILAKTHRDALLVALDQAHPEYGFAQHKGYPTPHHLEMLKKYGPISAHRRSFGPVRALLQDTLF